MKLPRFLTTKPTKKKLIISGVLFVFAVVAAVLLLNKGEVPYVQNEPEVFYSKLTGKEVSEELSKRPILGVMVENSEASRPQTGLDSAGIVFETVTEGGITRFLALYQDEMPAEVGPVRSLRPAFVDWLMGFDASVAHVGGSFEALNMVDERQTRTLNEMHNPKPYYRSQDRAAPHNVYARTNDLRALQSEKGHETSEFTEFARSRNTVTSEEQVTTIDVKFSHPAFATQYRYDKETNSYTRYMAGELHIDAATKKPITVKNVIVIQHSDGVKKGTGSGEALLFKDGNVFKIKWRKPDFKNQIELYHVEEGQEKSTELNVGDSWFAMLPGSGSVSYLPKQQ